MDSFRGVRKATWNSRKSMARQGLFWNGCEYAGIRREDWESLYLRYLIEIHPVSS